MNARGTDRGYPSAVPREVSSMSMAHFRSSCQERIGVEREDEQNQINSHRANNDDYLGVAPVASTPGSWISTAVGAEIAPVIRHC